MAESFDIVVAGAGHNSLITAAYLAKAGYRCVVLEGRPIAGGGVKSAHLTLEGFVHDVCSSAHNGIHGNPLLKNDELKLGDYGLEYIYPDPVFHMPFPDGSYLTQWRDLDRTCAQFAKFSKKDGAAYRRMITEYETVKPLLGAVAFSPIGFGKSLNELLAAHPQGNIWQRRLAMSAWEILKETFEDDHCRAFMLGCPYSLQPVLDPASARAAYIPLHQQRESRPLPKGGSGALTMALVRFIEAHQGLVLTSKWVTRLIIENGRCVGVQCADGSSYRGAKAVVSTVHIKQLIGMAPEELWGEDFLQGAETWEAGLTLFASNYATTEAPRFKVDGGDLSPVHSGIMISSERAMQMSLDYRSGTANTENPSIHVICCSVADPTRAPKGMHTVKIVAYQPYQLKGGPEHWDAIKYQVADANLKFLQRFSPNLTDNKILARTVESPLDWERMNPHNWHGSCHAGGWGPAQSGALRPMPGYAQHRMPIPGLYQTGATTHPGGSVTGGPGRNAAVVMLKDFGTTIEEVLEKNR
jgi:phytoene dehydrogenase-like protein